MWQHTEVFGHALSVEEIVGREEEVPAESPEPRQFIRLVHHIADGDDFMETLDLDCKNLQQKGGILKGQFCLSIFL